MTSSSSGQSKFPFNIPISYIIFFLFLTIILDVIFYKVLSTHQAKSINQSKNSVTEVFPALHTPTASHTPFQPGKDPTFTQTPTFTLPFAPIPTIEPTFTEIIFPTTTPNPNLLPESARISGITGHNQWYTLDCESRSASDWANFFGNNLSEATFLNKLPISDNPNLGFVGYFSDPIGQIPPESYGVHAGPIAALLTDLGTSAEAVTGFTWLQLRDEIAHNRPVIVWVIFNFAKGTPIEYVVPSDGSSVIVAHYEHTVIVIGYTETTVTALDGASKFTVSLTQFMDSWSVLGYMAVISR
jgi:uncharacterized protein YvpB